MTAGADRRARGRAGLDGGARLVDGGHGLRRRRVRVGRRRVTEGRAEIVRRVDALRPRLPAAVARPGRPRGVGHRLGAAVRAGPPEGKQPMPMGEAVASRAGRGAAAAARVPGASVLRPGAGRHPGCRRGRDCWAASAKRSSSRPPTPSCARRAPRFRTSSTALRDTARSRPGRPRRTISNMTRCSTS